MSRHHIEILHDCFTMNACRILSSEGDRRVTSTGGPVSVWSPELLLYLEGGTNAKWQGEVVRWEKRLRLH